VATRQIRGGRYFARFQDYGRSELAQDPLRVHGVQVLARAFDALDLFSSEAPAWSITEISVALGLPKSTVYRIFRMLEQRQYIVRNPETKKFRLGSGALSLGWRALATNDLRPLALPGMRRLATETGETVILTVVSEDRLHSVCIERIDSPRQVRLILEVGRRIFLHAGASSKILLAFLPPNEIERVIATCGLPRIFKNTITEPEVLRAHLAEIRRDGYSVSFEETSEGAAGIAAPILDDAGGIVAAVGIAGPLARFTEDELTRLIALTRRGAAEIARLRGSTHVTNRFPLATHASS
jgi:IclR family acetate operon transcriptional repressor